MFQLELLKELEMIFILDLLKIDPLFVTFFEYGPNFNYKEKKITQYIWSSRPETHISYWSRNQVKCSFNPINDE